jgi:putative peptidoglycan lipid II flippase
MVALGILLSRVVGLVRTRIFGHYLGTGDAADAFTTAFRIPNILQNLLGEGALSASFIPVYAGLLNRDDPESARKVARAVGALIALATTLAMALGVLAAPWLTDLVAGGFEGEKRALTVRLVRILFPGAALLVISAWCLGILNSHRRFFLSYAAPVSWNVAMIAALLGWGPSSDPEQLVHYVAWGSVAGSLLQVLVQLPMVLKVLGGLAGPMRGVARHVGVVVHNFGPAVLSRGVVQISAYIDTLIASYLPTGGQSSLGYALTLYNLPVSLFGMSVSAAELPEMAGEEVAGEERSAYLRERLRLGLRQIAFFVVPTTWTFVFLGHVVVGALYQSGRFTAADTDFVWAILAGSSLGLLATTLGRLYSSTFYALRDTRTPSLYALVRVGINVALGWFLALHAPRLLGVEERWGAAGLTIAFSITGWIEFGLLRRALVRRIGTPAPNTGYLPRLWAATATSVVVGWSLLLLLGDLHPIPRAVVVLGAFGFAYLGTTLALKVPEAAALLHRVRRRAGLPA